MGAQWQRRMFGSVLGLSLAGEAHGQRQLYPEGCLPERDAQAHNEATSELLRRYGGLRQGCAAGLSQFCELSEQTHARLTEMIERPPCIGEFFLSVHDASSTCATLEAMRRVAEVGGAQAVTAEVRNAVRGVCVEQPASAPPVWLQLSREDHGWHYPNGQLFHALASASWYYPNGLVMLEQGWRWYYPNRAVMHGEGSGWSPPRRQAFSLPQFPLLRPDQGVLAPGLRGYPLGALEELLLLGCARDSWGPLCHEARSQAAEGGPFWSALAQLQLGWATRAIVP